MFHSILKKEISSFFSSVTGYLVIGVFLLATGLMLWVIPGTYNIIDGGYAQLNGLFELAPWLFLFLCPAITMKAIAEEKMEQTWDLMISKPVGVTKIVLAKYAASWLLVLMALLPTLISLISVYYIAEPVGNVDLGAFWGSFTGLLLLAAVYLAIGIFASSLSKSQVLAFIIAFGMSFFIYYGFDLIAMFFYSGANIHAVESLGMHFHYKSISRGVLDSTDLLYFLVVCTLFLYLTVRKLKIK
ncbi:MAG: gliding motility-associated ABC transporter permease subunit GldF [Paludibacter sp.]|jgi:ABC-2 type transport system permease protein